MLQAVFSLKSPAPLHQFPWAESPAKLKVHCQDVESKQLSKDKIKECVQSVAEICTKRRDIETFAQNLIDSFSPTELDETFKVDFKKTITDTRKVFLNEMQPLISLKFSGKKGFAMRMIHQFFCMLERFLEKIGIIDLFEPSTLGSREGEMKKQQMALLSAIFSPLSATLIASLGPIHGSIATASIFGIFVCFGLSYSSWKPFPTFPPRIENLTDKLLKGNLAVGYERQGLIVNVMNTLKATKWGGRQPMLVGPEGAGKTECVYTLTQAIARGDYPEFSGFQVLLLNTSEISQMKEFIPESKLPLQFLSQKIGSDRAKTIFVFDQIDSACDPDPNFRMENHFIRMIDRSDENFPYMIGITTVAQFDKMKDENPRFADRFHRISVEKVQDDELTNLIRDSLYKKHPEALLEKDALKHLINKSEDKDVRELKSLVSRCAVLTSIEQKTELPREELESLFEAKKDLLEMKKNLHQLASDPNFMKNKEGQRMFYVLKEIMMPAIEESLKKKAKSKGIKLWIDTEVLDIVLSPKDLA